nr:hypothetical protein [Reyranella sp.]
MAFRFDDRPAGVISLAGGSHSSCLLNEALFLQTRQDLQHIRPASSLRYVEFSLDRSTKVGNGSGLLERIPDMDANPLESKINRTIEIENRDLIVDPAGNLPRRSLENHEGLDHADSS